VAFFVFPLLINKEEHMHKMPIDKYRPFPAIELPQRSWPSNSIKRAPVWCSEDLRDGNQALAIPMDIDKKLAMFNLLVSMGFKQIMVSFPSASQVEFDFTRTLIEKNIIPVDVTIEVLTQARDNLITRTFESLRGAKKAIVHVYNSTSELQRRTVFRTSKADIVDIASKGTVLVREETKKLPGTEIVYEYSPESFTGTELDFALETSQAVIDAWRPTRDKKMILNLPSTVEMATPNVYADQIEWMCSRLKNRESVIISVHAHNDRGTAVAATELALMAGAERVEGTLFGNGERTGNADILTLALNLFSQGVDPLLDFQDINRITSVYEKCTLMPVNARHPYAGELVYTAFSGSHQDAINKGMKAYQNNRQKYWEVPYLPIDPSDVGRTYECIIRINSQSGKGGVAYIMEQEFGFILPKEMHPEFGRVIQAISEQTGREVLPQEILNAFQREYFGTNAPLTFTRCGIQEQPSPRGSGNACGSAITAAVGVSGVEQEISGTGNGPVDAFCQALKKEFSMDFTLVSYHEHALEQGSDSLAVAYIQIEDGDRSRFFGAGIDTNISIASLKAVASALNRSPKIRTYFSRDASRGRHG
jgi:2-isopropylmalate synthase